MQFELVVKLGGKTLAQVQGRQVSEENLSLADITRIGDTEQISRKDVWFTLPYQLKGTYGE